STTKLNVRHCTRSCTKAPTDQNARKRATCLSDQSMNIRQKRERNLRRNKRNRRRNTWRSLNRLAERRTNMANDILIKIGADITDCSRKMKESNQALKGFADANKETFDAFKKTGALITGAGIALTAG